MNILKSKKGVSPLIATVLIIGFTIVLAAVVMQWGGSFVRTLTEQTASSADVQIRCMEIDFDAVATSPDTIKITNNKDNTISDVLIQKITTAGSTTLKSPSEGVVVADEIGPFISKIYTMTTTTFALNDQIRVIPYIKLDNNEEKGCSADVAVEVTAS